VVVFDPRSLLPYLVRPIADGGRQRSWELKLLLPLIGIFFGVPVDFGTPRATEGFEKCIGKNKYESPRS
jgi:hypothetical protein